MPSVDPMFVSVADSFGENALGIVLSGMGRDGAVGLGKLRAAGARTVAQDEATSAVYGMPKAAAEANAATDILPIEKIGEFLSVRLRRAERESGSHPTIR